MTQKINDQEQDEVSFHRQEVIADADGKDMEESMYFNVKIKLKMLGSMLIMNNQMDGWE